MNRLSKIAWLSLLALFVLSGCGAAPTPAPIPTRTPQPTFTPTPDWTPTPALAPTKTPTPE
ncbi:MAG: endoglucanase, partial [Anaerolineae bacterium]